MASYSPGAPTSPATARVKYASMPRAVPPAAKAPATTAAMTRAKASFQKPSRKSASTVRPPFPQLHTSIVAQGPPGGRRQRLPRLPSASAAATACRLRQSRLRPSKDEPGGPFEPQELQRARLIGVDGRAGAHQAAGFALPLHVARKLVPVRLDVGV